MKHNEQTDYVPPLVEIMQIQIEKGFAASADAGGSGDDFPWGNTDPMGSGDDFLWGN